MEMVGRTRTVGFPIDLFAIGGTRTPRVSLLAMGTVKLIIFDFVSLKTMSRITNSFVSNLIVNLPILLL